MGPSKTLQPLRARTVPRTADRCQMSQLAAGRGMGPELSDFSEASPFCTAFAAGIEHSKDTTG